MAEEFDNQEVVFLEKNFYKKPLYIAYVTLVFLILMLIIYLIFNKIKVIGFCGC